MNAVFFLYFTGLFFISLQFPVETRLKMLLILKDAARRANDIAMLMLRTHNVKQQGHIFVYKIETVPPRPKTSPLPIDCSIL